jgi:hypothetical protein
MQAAENQGVGVRWGLMISILLLAHRIPINTEIFTGSKLKMNLPMKTQRSSCFQFKIMVALLVLDWFGISIANAQTSAAPTGSCGFVMNKNFGGLGNSNVGYDYMQNYIGIIDFDKKTFDGAGNHVYNYQKSTTTVEYETFPTTLLTPDKSNFQGSYRYKLGSDGTMLTVVPVNNNNTFMIMLAYGKSNGEPSATGACQKR